MRWILFITCVAIAYIVILNKKRGEVKTKYQDVMGQHVEPEEYDVITDRFDYENSTIKENNSSEHAKLSGRQLLYAEYWKRDCQPAVTKTTVKSTTEIYIRYRVSDKQFIHSRHRILRDSTIRVVTDTSACYKPVYPTLDEIQVLEDEHYNNIAKQIDLIVKQKKLKRLKN